MKSCPALRIGHADGRQNPNIRVQRRSHEGVGQNTRHEPHGALPVDRQRVGLQDRGLPLLEVQLRPALDGGGVRPAKAGARILPDLRAVNIPFSSRAAFTRSMPATARRWLPTVSFHALRHTHASALIAAGIDVVKISKRLGHASPTVTPRIYAHLFNRSDEAAAVAIDAVMR
jgi:integrase